MHDDFQMLEFFSSKQNSKSLEKSMQLVSSHVFAMRGYRMSVTCLCMVLVELIRVNITIETDEDDLIGG